jgi:hypothetical protein
MDHALDASRDLDCLTQAVYYEARGEGSDGMKAVAQVVLNRVRHPAFPKTICGVVFQGAARSSGCQFSFTCSGVMRGRVNASAWTRARSVASGALSGSVFARVGNATHFHTTNVAPGWRSSLVQVSQVGSHLFYRFGGRSGAGNAFTYAAHPSSGAERPRLVQASLNPVETARQAGQAVAYSLVLAQEGLSVPTAHAAAPQPRAVNAQTQTPAQPVARSTGAAAPAARPARPAETAAKAEMAETAASPA